MPDEPIIDLQSDHYFMGEALRQATRAYEAEEVPVGAVVVRAGRIIARAFNQMEMLKDATAHAEMLALTQAEEAVGDCRQAECRALLQSFFSERRAGANSGEGPEKTGLAE